MQNDNGRVICDGVNVVGFEYTYPRVRIHRDPSNIVLIESEEQFNNSLQKVQDESLPAVFYFTAVWCGPCRLLSPIIGQLGEKYPHVTTYKIDIDK
ncbi:unnamed protein product, partial [Ilex paraguariensis]